jgi:hypothetical protein
MLSSKSGIAISTGPNTSVARNGTSASVTVLSSETCVIII